jgi:hypothetical protein
MNRHGHPSARRVRWAVALAATAVLALFVGLGTSAAHDPIFGVVPASVSDSLAPGGSVQVQKTVHTPEILPTPDIYFLADTTGSMDEILAAVQADAASVLGAVDALANDPRYGAGDYKDFQSPTQLDPYAFNNAAPSPAADDNGAAALAAIAAWSATGGFDGPEGQLFALHQLAAHGAASFRAAATPIVVWFGDAPGHDPVCDEISGDTGHDVTEASVTTELVNAGIRVIAISVVTDQGVFYPDALDDDPTAFAGDYVAACGVEGGTSGQATRIAAATDGVHLTGVTAQEIADSILEGLGALPVTVQPSAACDAGLAVSFNPASAVVTSGEDAAFTETITAAANAPQGSTLTCTVEFLVEGKLLDGFTEKISIDILDVTPPEAACSPTTNPGGKTIPPAGSNPASGQNPDGFYVLTGSDNVDEDVDIFLTDDASGEVFGPFENGTKIKLVQAPGATPSIKPGAGVIDWKITIQGDAVISVTDAAGNKTTASCLVPPPPK